jgi:thiosulfate/3-mercaptopyruvate sulfurtransferase
VTIDLDELARRLDEVTVLDVRSPEEYDGTFGAPCDPRQGHIPGAINLDVQELVRLSVGELGERLALPEGTEIVAYCHSGSRSAAAVRILASLGYNARNYPGSWHEWSQTDLPFEVSTS